MNVPRCTEQGDQSLHSGDKELGQFVRSEVDHRRLQQLGAVTAVTDFEKLVDPISMEEAI